MFAPGTSMILLTPEILFLPLREASRTLSTLYWGKERPDFLKMAVWVLLKFSAALTMAMSTFSFALKSLTYLFWCLGFMVIQPLNRCEDMTTFQRVDRGSTSLSLGQGQKLKTLTMKRLTKS
jgi:hypothetical protein